MPRKDQKKRNCPSTIKLTGIQPLRKLQATTLEESRAEKRGPLTTNKKGQPGDHTESWQRKSFLGKGNPNFRQVQSSTHWADLKERKQEEPPEKTGGFKPILNCSRKGARKRGNLSKKAEDQSHERIRERFFRATARARRNRIKGKNVLECPIIYRHRL